VFTLLSLFFSLSKSSLGKTNHFTELFFSLVCSSSSSCSHRISIEPALAAKFTLFRFCDEDNDDDDDDLAVSANARRVLLRARMLINWFLSICFFYAL
jgi:hypothetical protein|tara:strand:- start:242 stop:535 length:294 start_codon:yes stop_codon:yes gene_type:complete